jgi:hypothetical protein
MAKQPRIDILQGAGSGGKMPIKSSMYRSPTALLLGFGLALLCLAAPPERQETRLVPTNLKKLNSAKDEDDPYLYVSHDRRVFRLFYSSNASGRSTILMSEPNKKGEWQPGETLEGLDPEIENTSPCLSLDAHDLYFASKIPGKGPEADAAKPNFDIVHSINLTKPGQFTAPTPVQSVCTKEDELHPWLTSDGKELYFSRKTADGWRLFVATRLAAAGAFNAPRLIEELPPGFHHATLTSDERTMFLQGPLENGRWGLFRSKRSKKGERWIPWSVPQELHPLNSPADKAPTGDMSPSLSRDDRKLLFVSDRQGGQGGRDLWMINAGGLMNMILKTKGK